MRYLGIDFGEKRVGLSVSDEEGKVAFPYAVIQNDSKLLEETAKIIEKEKIDEIVIGESKNFSGEPNIIMADIEKFKKNLEEKIKLKVHFEPEFMTSQQAERIQGKNETLDASAAAIILQSFLDKQQSML